MRYLLALCLLFGVYAASAQTELINHKSHSGTNKDFKVKKGSGNFGLSPVRFSNELERDTTSSYKLVYTHDGANLYNINYILFKTTNKALTNNMCMTNDEVLANISLTIITPDIRNKVEKLLIEQLMALRKTEK